MPLKIVRNDITKMQCDAIVNTASAYPANTFDEVGAGCDKAIHKAAGAEKLIAARKEIGVLKEGEAALTPAFSLPAKYIIHAVSPIYIDGKSGEEKKLRNCYRNSLKIARKNGAESIAFPLIATGSFGYPQEEGMRIAVDEINSFLLKHEMLIYLVVFGSKATMLGQRIDPDLKAYIDHHYVDEKREEEYGDAHWGSVRPGSPEYNTYAAEREGLERGLRLNRIPIKPTAPSPSEGSSSFMGAAFQAGATAFSAAPLASPRSETSTDKSRRKKTPQFKAKPKAALQDEDSLSNISVGSALPDEDIVFDALPECMSPLPEEEFDEEHESQLNARVRHLADTFSEYLMFLIEEKGLNPVDVYKRAIVDKKVFSKIKNNPKHHPNKMTAMCLCIGANLNLDESKDLLSRAGYALSPCDMTDVIFSYFIEHRIYDMIELDIQLEEHGQKCLIQ